MDFQAQFIFHKLQDCSVLHKTLEKPVPWVLAELSIFFTEKESHKGSEEFEIDIGEGLHRINILKQAFYS